MQKKKEYSPPTWVVAMIVAALAVAVGWAVIPMPAKAADKGKTKSMVVAQAEPAAQSWTGFYVGVGGARANAATELDLSVAGPGSILNLDSLNSDGWLGFVQVGYDLRLPNQPYLVGVFARYHGLGESEFSLSVPAAGISILSASFEKELQIGARAGYVLSGGALVYAGGYWAQAGMSWSLLNGALTGSEKLNGYGVLGGIEVVVAPNVSLAIEYTKTMFNDVNYGIGPLNLKVDTDIDAVLGRISYRLN